MRMIALKRFPYKGKRIRPGDEFTVGKADIRFLELTGNAEKKPVEVVKPARKPRVRKVVEVKEEVVQEETTEETTEEITEAETTEEVEISPRTGLPKRQYRRRDMEAE